MTRLNRIVTGRVAILIALGAIAGGCAPKSAARRDPPSPLVVVVKAEVRDVPIVATSNATTSAASQVTITARVRGFLKEANFKEGSDVKVGQLLFVIDEEPFQVQVAQAKAKLAEAEAAMMKAEQSKAREIATAKVALDQAAMMLAKVEEQRTASLFSRNAAAKGDVDSSLANRLKAEAQVDADRASLDQAGADYRTDILSAKATVAMARASLRDSEINLGYCRMSAPIDGRIGEKLIKVGNLVGSGNDNALATIQQLDPMGINLQVSSRYLPKATQLVGEGMTMTINVGGDRPHEFPAKSTFIDNRIDTTTSTFLMKAITPNPNKTLLPGEYSRVEMVIGEHKGAVVVPEKALVETQAGPTVYIVDDAGKAAPKPVTVAETYRGVTVIESGLVGGQRVICEGLQLIRPGLTVKAEDATFASQVRSTTTVPTPVTAAPSRP